MHLTIEEACTRLKVSRSTIRRMCLDGRLEATRSETSPRGRVLIDAKSFDRLAKKQVAEFGKASR